MKDSQVLTETPLVWSEQAATVHAPIEKVDIANWLLNLPDAEYQRCAPPDHIAAGYTTTDDGRPMSINVEEIGGTLLVEHYVGEILEPHHCRMVSLTDAQTPLGWTKIQVTWDLSVTKSGTDTCQYINRVQSYPTRGFLDILATAGQTLEQAAAERQASTDDHNRRETAKYAVSIGHKALAGA